mgnify:CR=1 FL=1
MVRTQTLKNEFGALAAPVRPSHGLIGTVPSTTITSATPTRVSTTSSPDSHHNISWRANILDGVTSTVTVAISNVPSIALPLLGLSMAALSGIT